MIIPIILSILAAFFWATGNHIDKYLISKAVKNTDFRALIIVSTIIAGGLMALIYLFICNFNLTFDIQSFLLLLINATLYVAMLILYYKALDRDDTTIVAILFQLVPVCILLLSPLFLRDQNITLPQLFGGILITLAAIFVTYEPSRKKFSKNRLVTLIIMTIVSFMEAIWFIIQKHVNETHDFNQTTFWFNISLIIVGAAILLFFKSFRKSFVKMLKTNGPRVISLNLVNELLNSFSLVFTTYAGTLISIAVVSFVAQGVQPFAVMLIGLTLTEFFPKVAKEKTTKSETIKRFIAIAVCLIGLALIELS